MNKSWIKYLGVLGFLGTLGYFTDNPGFYGFFGFFGFFGFAKIVNDERFLSNVNKACRNAFVASILFYALIMVYAAISKNYMAMAFGFAINFALIILIFTISLQYYDHVGK